MTTNELAERAGLAVAVIDELEHGGGWIASYGTLIQLSNALGVGPVELSGRPVPPGNRAEAELRSTAFFIRRHLADPSPRIELGSDTSVARLLRAQADGDESALAAQLLECLRADVQPEVYAAGAGLLRRLGYADLSWLMLHKVRASGHPSVADEETRLLLDLGQPQAAALRAEEAGTSESPTLRAMAHAVLREGQAAHEALTAAERHAEAPDETARVQAARAAVALELGYPHEATDHTHRIETGHLTRAEQYDLLIVSARAHALLDHAITASDLLQRAHGTAPSRFPSDPLARELLHHLRRVAPTVALP
ncbi:helix-turn-helix transcriptional regulator [Streptomyces sp. NPDC049881]|uniref:helix-turn-helix domain-containing protein n=1 Tax=Streptomyces sp. NPDC049881 TaxID=3155778 RepID=UPI00341E94D4